MGVNYSCLFAIGHLAVTRHLISIEWFRLFVDESTKYEYKLCNYKKTLTFAHNNKMVMQFFKQEQIK